MADIMFYGDNLQKVISEICTEGTDGEVRFHNNYSGRGMYGKQCVGIAGSKGECMAVIGEVLKFANGNEEEDFAAVVDTLLNFQQDSMGYDVILYWPELPPISEEGQEEDGDSQEGDGN